MTYPAIILDTETTDVENADVIELAWRTDVFSETATTRGHQRFKPTREIKLGALATHHILLEELADCVASSVAPSVVPPASYWIGHNIDFDWKMLGQPPVKRICTLAMARSIWPKLDTHRQEALIYFIEGRTEATREKVSHAHGAAADIEMTASIFRAIAKLENIFDLDQMWAFSENCRIPKIMSFGKFKGEPVSAVDRGWANWYQRQTDTDPYLLTALKRAGKL